MKQEILGFLVIGSIAALIVGGALHVTNAVSRDNLEEELESWGAGDQEWLKQLLEERQREAEKELKRRSV